MGAAAAVQILEQAAVVAPAAAVAAQHSQCFASWYSNIPGLITIAPYDAEDNKGLLKAAIRSKEVVMFLENENLYGESY